jgi:hypothetical protein
MSMAVAAIQRSCHSKAESEGKFLTVGSSHCECMLIFPKPRRIDWT